MKNKLVFPMVSLVAAFGLMSCSEDSEITIPSATSLKSLPLCDSANDGEVYHVSNENADYTCHDGAWTSEDGLSYDPSTAMTVYKVDHISDLGKCTDDMEGQFRYVADDNNVYVCLGNEWGMFGGYEGLLSSTSVEKIPTKKELEDCTDSLHKQVYYVEEDSTLYACVNGDWMKFGDAIDEAKSRVSMLVVDSRTKEAIEQVDVVRISDGKEATTSESGYVNYTEGGVGDVMYELSKEGYATTRVVVNIKDAALDSAYTRVAAETVKLHKLGAKVKGSVHYKDPSALDKTVGASDVTVVLTVADESIVPNEISTKTDSLGNFTFKDLPEGVGFNISVAQTVVGDDRYGNIAPFYVEALRVDETEVVPVKMLSVVTENVDAVQSMVSFLVIDSKTNEAVDSVTISRVSDAKTIMTNGSGNANYVENTVGNVIYELSKTGYATVRISVGVSAAATDSLYTHVISKTVKMRKLGGSVIGTVLYRDPATSLSSAAKKVLVTLTCSDESVVPSIIETTTDSVGNYKFEDLAEGVEYTLKIAQTSINDQSYGSVSAGYVSVSANESRVMSTQTMQTIDQKVEWVSSNLDGLTATDDLLLNYNRMLVADSVKNTKWTVTRNSKNVLVKVSLEKDGSSIRIHPQSGKWSSNIRYSLNGYVYTAEGYSKYISAEFIPDRQPVVVPGHVKNLTLDSSYSTASQVRLTWTAPEEPVYGYKVFYKTSSLSDFIQVANVTDTDVDGEVVTYASIYNANSSYYSNYVNITAEDDSIQFVVLPYNIDGETPEVKTAEQKAIVRPVDVKNLTVKYETGSTYYIDIDWEDAKVDPSIGGYSIFAATGTGEFQKVVANVYRSAENHYNGSLSTMYYNVAGTSKSCDVSMKFYVAPYNFMGYSNLSAADTVKFVSNYCPVSIVEINDDDYADNSTLTVEWEPSTASTVTGYIIYIATSYSGTYNKVATASAAATKKTISLLDADGNNKYADYSRVYFKVTAYSKDAEGVLENASYMSYYKGI